MSSLSLSVVYVVVVDMVVHGVRQPDRSIAPACQLVVVDLEAEFLALKQESRILGHS